jgi:hypothetical protein
MPVNGKSESDRNGVTSISHFLSAGATTLTRNRATATAAPMAFSCARAFNFVPLAVLSSLLIAVGCSSSSGDDDSGAAGGGGKGGDSAAGTGGSGMVGNEGGHTATAGGASGTAGASVAGTGGENSAGQAGDSSDSGGAANEAGSAGAGEKVSEGITYCSAESPLFEGPAGYKWALYANPGACATATCTPTKHAVCASLTSPGNSKAGVAVVFDAPVDLSGTVGVAFTADVSPVGAAFEASIASTNGARGMSWNLTAQPGSTTYQVAFNEGFLFSTDGVAFDFSNVTTFDVSSSFVPANTIDVTVSDLKLVP